MNSLASIFNLGDQSMKKAQRRAVHNIVEIDPELLSVEHNCKVPTRRARPVSKYQTIFKTMRPGSAIKCEPSETGPLRTALRHSIKIGDCPHLEGCIIKVVSRADDGRGRVIAMAPAKAR